MKSSTSLLAPRATSKSDKAPVNFPAPFRPFVEGAGVIVVGKEEDGKPGAEAVHDATFVYSPGILQDLSDYRGLIQQWFAMLGIGGKLAIEVPHSYLCERELALPSQTYPSRRRLYTPASLLGEVEEALEPNSYRVRLLCDYDEGYDYEGDKRSGSHSILLLLERIAVPEWSLDSGSNSLAPPPDFEFEPGGVRQERATLAPRRRILLLKLDHLGDFIMGVPALEKVREAFPDASITLVVGSWNLSMAQDLGLFETVVAFDAFPRNSSEEAVNLENKVAQFKRLVTGKYDLAIDLRADGDTRFFLTHAQAEVRAGIGTRAQYPYLDIFLPIDASRYHEVFADMFIDLATYTPKPACIKSAYRIRYDPKSDEALDHPDSCLIHGPYLQLIPGEYFYQPKIEIEGTESDLLLLDVAVNGEQVAAAHARRGDEPPRLAFRVDEYDARAEFRVYRVDGATTPTFSFFGGRVLRRASESVLHQSEYLALLIHLVKMRVDEHGLIARNDPHG